MLFQTDIFLICLARQSEYLFLLCFVCMYGCACQCGKYTSACFVCMSIHETAHTCVNSCLWRQEVYIKCVFFIHLCFETEFLTEPGAHQLARQEDQRALATVCLCPSPSTKVTNTNHHSQFSHGCCRSGLSFSCWGFAGPKLNDLSKNYIY